MRNKELKVGDKIWTVFAYMSYTNSGYTVKSVKRTKTLVTVTCEGVYYNGKTYEVTMYGHYNSCILSGYDRKWGNDETCYTCDYSLIQKKTDKYESEQKQMNAGYALLELVKYFK